MIKEIGKTIDGKVISAKLNNFQIIRLQEKYKKIISEQEKEPIIYEGILALGALGQDKDLWFFKDKVFILSKDILKNEAKLRIKHFLLKKEKELSKISKEIEAFENFDITQKTKRERVPENIRLFVWQRDEGRCVKCGNNEKLEFDHIIPIVKGGSNTERNIQLLCERCNRSKSKNI